MWTVHKLAIVLACCSCFREGFAGSRSAAKSEVVGNLIVRFIKFSNPRHVQANGHNCDVGWFGSNKCDPQFTVCFVKTETSWNLNNTESVDVCDFGGPFVFGPYDNVAEVGFGATLGTINNPLVLNISQAWQGSEIRVQVDEMERGSFLGANTAKGPLIDRFSYFFNSRPSLNTLKLRLAGFRANTSLLLEASIKCLPNYYDVECSTHCVPSVRQDCHMKTGAVICKPGWSGDECEAQVLSDDLAIHPFPLGMQVDEVVVYDMEPTQNSTGIAELTTLNPETNTVEEFIHQEFFYVAPQNLTTAQPDLMKSPHFEKHSGNTSALMSTSGVPTLRPTSFSSVWPLTVSLVVSGLGIYASTLPSTVTSAPVTIKATTPAPVVANSPNSPPMQTSTERQKMVPVIPCTQLEHPIESSTRESVSESVSLFVTPATVSSPAPVSFKPSALKTEALVAPTTSEVPALFLSNTTVFPASPSTDAVSFKTMTSAAPVSVTESPFHLTTDTPNPTNTFSVPMAASSSGYSIVFPVASNEIPSYPAFYDKIPEETKSGVSSKTGLKLISPRNLSAISETGENGSSQAHNLSGFSINATDENEPPSINFVRVTSFLPTSNANKTDGNKHLPQVIILLSDANERNEKGHFNDFSSTTTSSPMTASSGLSTISPKVQKLSDLSDGVLESPGSTSTLPTKIQDMIELTGPEENSATDLKPASPPLALEISTATQFNSTSANTNTMPTADPSNKVMTSTALLLPESIIYNTNISQPASVDVSATSVFPSTVLPENENTTLAVGEKVIFSHTLLLRSFDAFTGIVADISFLDQLNHSFNDVVGGYLVSTGIPKNEVLNHLITAAEINGLVGDDKSLVPEVTLHVALGGKPVLTASEFQKLLDTAWPNIRLNSTFTSSHSGNFYTNYVSHYPVVIIVMAVLSAAIVVLVGIIIALARNQRTLRRSGTPFDDADSHDQSLSHCSSGYDNPVFSAQRSVVDENELVPLEASMLRCTLPQSLPENLGGTEHTVRTISTFVKATPA